MLAGVDLLGDAGWSLALSDPDLAGGLVRGSAGEGGGGAREGAREDDSCYRESG
ncbi:hypothetical protein GCM10027601_04940 [Nocardioides ungokensis]|uniref:hypothetical protein n=1 Tax=Nocardioides ungokensis TaxID=1643322 RepID=UPI0015DF696F|nr:hypothetical protein [Nocardioides ungokensis]